MKLPYRLYVICFALLLSSCKDIEQRKTSILIVDNNRHYYPITQGQKIDMVFEIKNVGRYPFVLSDLFASCGCIYSDKSSVSTIPPGKSGNLIITYDSNKNVGLVRHFITLYGNLESQEKMEVVFDLHVVPDALYTKDYEELYREEIESGGMLKKWVDGEENNQGYYMDKDLEEKKHITE